jgi:hypothetical protein
MIDLTLALLLGVLGAAADEPQAKPAPPAAPAQDTDRPVIAASELKALRESNIFAPKSASKRPTRKDPTGPRTAPAPVKPKAPLVTAIFFDSVSQTYQVIVEDRNDSSHRFFKDPKFMKAGDEWSGIKLESVVQDKAVFSRDGDSKEVRIGEGIAEIDSKPLSAAVDSEGFDDAEAAVPAESSPAPSTGSTTVPSPSKKSMNRSRTEPKTDSGGDSKTLAPENQSKTLEEMKRRLKKNRATDEQ